MPLARLEVEITLESPLLVGADRTYGLYRPTRRYLPGSALRGSLAKVLLNKCTRPDYKEVDHDACPDKDRCDFYRLFCQPPVPIFENCYPSESGSTSFPLPLTARTCKRRAGFVDPDKPEEYHGVFDILVRQYTFEVMLDARVRLPYLYGPCCSMCGEKVKPQPGFYGEGRPKYGQQRAPVGRTTRTAINRQRAVAADEQLFTLETIDVPRPDQYFSLVGSVLVDEGRVELLRNALLQVRHLGQGRSRGLGRVRVNPRGCDEPPWMDDLWLGLEERVRQLNEQIRKEWAFYEKIAPDCPSLPDGVWFFSVDLLAPAILTYHGLPTVRLEPSALGLEVGGIQLVRSFARHEVTGGWHWGAKLPRPTELTTEMGGAFLFRVESHSQEELMGALHELERRGVGRQRERGFGQVQICSPFHLEVRG